MLLSSLSIALIACLFGFKQSRELKRSQDLINKQGIELELLRTQYKHNLRSYSSLVKLNDELGHENYDLNEELKELKELKDEYHQADEARVLDIISQLDLELKILTVKERSFTDLVYLYINTK